MSAGISGPVFQLAPQRKLCANPRAHPSDSVTSFRRENGIDHACADPVHPNSIVPDAIAIATSGETQVLCVP